MEDELRSTTVDVLRRNHPDKSEIAIYLGDENDAELAQALEQNLFVLSIDLNFRGVAHTNWPRLCRVLATRANTENVHLCDRMHSADRASSAHNRLFIGALQVNQSIQSISFRDVNLSEEALVAFLDAARSVTKVVIVNCVIEPVPGRTQDGTRTLAAALQRNQQIQDLSLDGFGAADLVPILRSLVASKNLKHFQIVLTEPTIETSNAIQELLESTSSIQTFELRGRISTEEMFRPIAEGLTRSRTVVGTSVENCDFTDTGSVGLVGNLIRSKRNLRSLTLRSCDFDEPAVVQSALREALLRHDSSLRSLCLDGRLVINMSIADFCTLLGAVQKSKLEEFSIGGISNSSRHFRALLESLPAMKIKKLIFRDYLGVDARRLEMLLALKQNFSLQSARIGWLDDEEDERLQFYLTRNKRLAQWVDNPASVPQPLWPEALRLALEAGEETLYRSLQAVLGNEVESALSGQRKRKRQAEVDDET